MRARKLRYLTSLQRILEDIPFEPTEKPVFGNVTDAHNRLQTQLAEMSQVYYFAGVELRRIKVISEFEEGEIAKIKRTLGDYETYMGQYYDHSNWADANNGGVSALLSTAKQAITNFIAKKDEYFSGLTKPFKAVLKSTEPEKKSPEAPELKGSNAVIPSSVPNNPTGILNSQGAATSMEDQEYSDEEDDEQPDPKTISFSLNARWNETDKVGLEAFIQTTKRIFELAMKANDQNKKDEAESEFKKYCRNLFLIYHSDRNPKEQDSAERIFKELRARYEGILEALKMGRVDAFDFDQSSFSYTSEEDFYREMGEFTEAMNRHTEKQNATLAELEKQIMDLITRIETLDNQLDQESASQSAGLQTSSAAGAGIFKMKTGSATEEVNSGADNTHVVPLGRGQTVS
ncbi:MAG: hypothetical protein AB7F64_07890 [Gammaproteobacteria bacterium]